MKTPELDQTMSGADMAIVACTYPSLLLRCYQTNENVLHDPNASTQGKKMRYRHTK